PVSTIKIAIKNLQKGADQSALFKIIEEENERMEDYIQSVLDLSKIRHKNFNLNLKSVEMRPMIEDIVNKERLLLCGTEDRIEIVHVENTVLSTDESHLRNAISNIIENARVYSGDVVNIEITAQKNQNQYQISIKDHGIGIPPAELNLIFDRFYRGQQGNLYYGKGTGLGLNYAQRIVQLHSGSIEVKSIESEGSTFIITLPIE
ncbi:HAMP domain-containing histidine kinase, partial [bacterium]|nr:HAMP domain-containing histidine kinase [bacterium]